MILRELLEVFSVETSIMILDVTTGAPQILARGILHYVELDELFFIVRVIKRP